MNFNLYWYLGLGFLSLILMIFVYCKKRNIHSLLQLLIMIQVAYLIETVIYVFLGSYLYHPKLIRYNAYYDSHMGALISNLITIPVLATFISTFQLNGVWIICCIGLLAAIEWLFVKLQIYSLHWWRIEYTSLGLLLYFPLAKVLYKQILRPLKGFLHSLFLFLCITPILGSGEFFPLFFFNSRVYLPGWFKNIYYDTSAFAVVYYLGISLFLVVMAELRWKHKGSKYVLTAVVILTSAFTLRKTGILYSFVWWDQWFYVLYPLIILRIAAVISKRLSTGSTISST